MGFGFPAAAPAQSIADLRNLSIEELGNVEVTSASKQPQKLSTAATSIYVIGHDDIIRSGAQTIPEILRLAPNLFVSEVSPVQYTITARGLSGNIADQNPANKLLVLVDGRSVYSPLFAGVYWDTLGILPEDIERIEVISGPGGTLWGANAINGVINIITRKSADTQGGYFELGGGNYQNLAALQYGGSSGSDLSWRVYTRAIEERSLENSAGQDTHDGYWLPQIGFRVDWNPSSDHLTFEGNYYYGQELQPGAPEAPVEGRNFQVNWQRDLGDGSSIQVLGYYDQSRRSVQGGGTGFSVDTFDFQVQHIFTLAGWNDIVWGAEERAMPYTVTDRIGVANSLLFEPSSRTLNLADIFAQDQIGLAERLTLTLGLKIEDDPYSGVTPMPTARLAWQATDTNLLWTGVSRAIRSPTPFDVDVVEQVSGVALLKGNSDFLPEDLIAYEAGYRGQLADNASLSVTAYYDDYTHLRSIEFVPGATVPFEWANMMEGHTYGLEAWGDYKPFAWWKLSAGVDLLREGFHFEPGATDFLGVSEVGDDPHHQAFLRSSVNFSDWVTFDADLRYVGELPNPEVPQYVELNSRVGWSITPRIEISLSGFNLLHPQHQEYVFPYSDEVPRSFFVDTRWKF